MAREIRYELPPSTENLYTNTYDYSAGKLIYSGRAAPGASKGSPVWQIKKYLYSGNDLVDIQWCDGDILYDNIWNNRASYSYS